MNINNAFPSKYLKTSDIDKPRVLTIASVEMDSPDPDEPQEEKPVLFFQGAKKGMVLNRGNATMLAQLFGDETDSWPGQSIEIYTAHTQYRGQPTMGMRLRAPTGPATPQPPAQPAADTQSEDSDDDIPF